ncbi:hypothetical protein [Loktanella sp. Alg231-35]|uniref:hypothetical protein n=1 Tax=Loktanella sp. Alg231-35 TaxID=1922220 RepID=UPI000D55BE4D|nr:hypothetical protein [Loktanella sp. Alg231-35]
MFLLFPRILKNCCPILVALVLSAGATAQTVTDELDQRLDRLEGLLDQSQLSVAGLAASLPDDPELIAQEIAARIAWRIYPGVLRGAEGALAAGAGNSWDQALLLRAVLDQKGYETRLALARLEEETAIRLVAGIEWPATRPATSDPTAFESAVVALGGGDVEVPGPFLDLIAGRPPTATPSPAAEEAAGMLRQALGPQLPNGAAQGEASVEAARNYAWVQARIGGAWRNLHLAGLAIDPAPDTTLTDVPDEALQSVRLTLSIERSDGSSDVILETLDVHAADVLHSDLPFVIAPLHEISGDPAPEPGAEIFLPIVAGRLLEGTHPFGADGTLRELDDVLAGGASEAIGGFASALGGLSSEIGGGLGGELAESLTSSADLVAVTMELEIHEPFEAWRVDWRQLAAEDGRLPRDWVPGYWSVIVHTGRATPAHLLDVQIASIKGALRVWETEDYVPLSTLPLLNGYDLAAGRAAGADGLIYRGAPLIAVRTLRALAGGREIETFDIRQSGLNAWRETAGGWEPAADIAILAGVEETLFEDLLVLGEDPVESSSAFRVLADAESLRLVDVSDVLTSGADQSARQAALADLGAGSLVVARSNDPLAWWRVDPVTGTATGIDITGRGGSFIDRTIILGEYTFEVAKTLHSVYSFKKAAEACNNPLARQGMALMFLFNLYMPVMSPTTAGMLDAPGSIRGMLIENSGYGAGGKLLLNTYDFLGGLVYDELGGETYGVGSQLEGAAFEAWCNA